MCSCCGECICCVLVEVSVFCVFCWRECFWYAFVFVSVIGCLLLWLVQLVCSCWGECIWCVLVVLCVFGVLLL